MIAKNNSRIIYKSLNDANHKIILTDSITSNLNYINNLPVVERYNFVSKLYHLKKYTNYKCNIKFKNIKKDDNIEISIRDGNNIKLLNKQINVQKLRNNGTSHTISFFYTFDDDDVSLTVTCLNYKNRKIKYDVTINHSEKFRDLHNLILFGNYITSDDEIYKYRNILPNNGNDIIINSRFNHDITELFGFRRHNFMSMKVYSENNPSVVAKKLDNSGADNYMYCVFGYSAGSSEFFVGDKIINKLGKSLSMVSHIGSSDINQYGIVSDKEFYINKMCYFPITNELFNLEYSITNFTDYKVMVIIAFTERYDIMEKNLYLLNKQTLKPGVVLVGTTITDIQFCKKMQSIYSNIHYIKYQNKPLGLKWQVGVFLARSFNPKSILILGSDDIITQNYVENMYMYIEKGYDMIGKREWYVLTDGELYNVKYTKKISISLGGGRIYSGRILDKFNWYIFECLRDQGLDTLGYYMIKKLGGKIMVNTDNVHILSIKGNWEMMNSFDKILKHSKIENPSVSIKKVDDNFLKRYFPDIV
jgi:hypothetical protein